ncbi:MAG TPA: hypothetical protein DEO88_16745 [Syntrophobacteraceae bacterium]|nr:hypothetical protein [Syntrophobacteraceae bacterium]
MTTALQQQLVKSRNRDGMNEAERQQDDPSQIWQKADARVLGQILAAQNIAFALPDTTRIAEFYAQTLISIPGIAACRVCLGGRSVQAGEMESSFCADCETLRRSSWEDHTPLQIDSILRCNLGAQPDVRVVAIDSHRYRFGFFVIKIEQAMFGNVYQPFISNVSNHLALMLENRWQKDMLQRAHDELERKVEERTHDLTAANKELTASRLAALDLMEKALGAQQIAEQASTDLQREITERQRVEAALLESEAKYRAVVENSLAGVYIIQDDLLRFVNRRWCEIFGYTYEEAVDKLNPIDLSVMEDRRTIADNLKKRLSGEAHYIEYDLRAIRKDGEVITVKILGSAMTYKGRPAVSGTMIDITERKQAEEALHQANETLRAMLDTVPVGIFDLDTEGRVRRIWNPAAERLLGWRRDEVLGQFLPAVPEGGLDEFTVFREWVRSGKSIAGKDLVHRRKDGPIIEYSLYAAPEYDADGNVVGNIAAIVDVTERKLAERALKESEVFLNTLLNAIPIPVFYKDTNGRYLGFNTSFEAFFDATREQLIGKTVFEIYPPELARVYYAKDNELFVSGGTQRYESQITNVRGEAHDVIFNKAVFADNQGVINGLIGTILDITERKRAEQVLSEKNQFILSLLRAIPVAVFYKDREGRYQGCNDTFTRITGVTAEEILGKRVGDLWPSELADRYHHADLELMKNRGHQEYEFQVKAKSGQMLPVLFAKDVYLDKDGEVAGLVGAFLDITERKRAEEEILKLNLQLEERIRERTAQLEAANQELEAFAYSVSHDLRAPLRHIDGFLGLLQISGAAVLDERTRHYMASISEATQRMGALIDDLLSFSRMGRKEFSQMTVDLNDLTQEVIREIEPDAQGRVLHWHVADLPVVSGDLAMLRIVLVNLISNAVKFTRACEHTEIEIGCLPGPGIETVVFVRDNGVGFDMAYADKLFGVFQRLHRLDDFEGTGIGLANVRRIIHRHGGRTWAEGQVGHGATFYFSLP